MATVIITVAILTYFSYRISYKGLSWRLVVDALLISILANIIFYELSH